MSTLLSTAQIPQAADILRAGELVAFPTETVYGLGADARSDRAVAKIYDLKQRPSFNPLIVHVKDRISAECVAVFDDRARRVADLFWPGPLTLVLPLRGEAGISPLATAGLGTVAVRVPAHAGARALLAAFDGPVVAPSANRSGFLSPTTPAHVIASFGDRAPVILAGGAAEVGVESTILDLSVPDPVILRAGGVTAEDIAAVLGAAPRFAHEIADNGQAPKSPGMLLKHYAPRVPVRLRAVDVKPGEGLLAFGSVQFMGVQGGGFARDLPPDTWRNLSESGDLIEAAHNLFNMLHELEVADITGIAVMDIPNVGMGVAINDRLARAAAL